MKKTSKPKNPNIVVTQGKLNRIKEDATVKAIVLFVATCMDEFDWTEDDVEAFAVRFARYKDAVDTHLLSIKKVQEIIERVMGIKVG